MAYGNSLYWRDPRSVDMKVWTDLYSGNTLAVDSDALWKAWITNLSKIDMQLSTLPTSLGKLYEFTTLSTALLLLFFSSFFIKKIVVGKVRL